MVGVRQWILSCLPEAAVQSLRRYRRNKALENKVALPALSEQEFVKLLSEDMAVPYGGVVMVHSSSNDLHLNFPLPKVLTLLRDAVGPEGTLVFMTMTMAENELEYLDGSKVFDVCKTPTSAGLLSEFARRLPGAQRSLHPTRSVCAIGPLAEELTNSHHLSPYPFDKTSPYGKLIANDGLVIGLGVTAYNLTVAHCVEDFLRDEYPLKKYLGKAYDALCIDAQGNEVIVPCLASNPAVRAGKDCVDFFKENMPDNVLKHFSINGQDFFKCHSAPFHDRMMELAARGKTIYGD